MSQEFMAGVPETPKNDEYPKPMTFEEFVNFQKPIKDEKGQIIEFTQEEKEKNYSGYVGFFYSDLKQVIQAYSSYMEYFYTSGAKNAYDEKNNPKPMSFKEFHKKNKAIK